MTWRHDSIKTFLFDVAIKIEFVEVVFDLKLFQTGVLFAIKAI